METLWAPWRMSYVSTHKPADGDPCFICRGLSQDDDRSNLILQRTPLSVAVVNRFPYNNGHLLVCPKHHKASMAELTPEELLDQQETIRRLIRATDALMAPHGYNVGVNLGSAAGAGVPGHLHWHVVPRWNGDTNFMPVLSDTRIIVQSLDRLYELLKQKLADETGPR